jgi:hypothetical protein
MVIVFLSGRINVQYPEFSFLYSTGLFTQVPAIVQESEEFSLAQCPREAPNE